MLLASLTLSPAYPAEANRTPPATEVEDIRGKQWHLNYLDVSGAHKISQGDGIRVAVIDTGVHPHPDLRNNLLPGANVAPEEIGDGRHDQDGHGTGMGGLIAAHGQSVNKGALGIAPRARILPVRFKLEGSLGSAGDLARAIEHATHNGADVISISSAGGPDVRVQQAIDAAAQADVVLVAAAGNQPHDQHVGFPAAYPNVVAVGGIDRDSEHADVSVSGDEIDVVAPAVEIYSTGIDGEYRVGTGTSGAAAIVAGAAALVRAKYPYLPADEVAHRLTATAIDKGPPGRDDQYGYGVIDLVAALTADVPPRGFESMPATAPGGGSTTAADGPRADPERDASVRGLITLGVLLAAGGAWAWFVRRRRRSDDPPPRISR
ncbi:type VII secretion-associated serine protease mycosin [Micromonospora endophytica]|uniref:Type VII secretion-associated serine protease mycosin n=1 Tax=Micromonospora endophytica TaxID=515350 RepID=A0A2W2CXN6_9ACTN|nr:type VII secretion-associated serine protease mycosin [Micromonospora endophytica]RIW45476.1 type VII secretion-associated serine protease mycosin [Micromonospora endophytica]